MSTTIFPEKAETASDSLLHCTHLAVQLPEVTVYSVIPHHDELILSGGGRAPSALWLKAIKKERPVWCIDHGIDICYQTGILPQRLIGDGDSASPAAWQWAMDNHVPINKFNADKDLTDTQLALEMVMSDSNISEPFVILTGGLGGRLDHAFSTIYSFANSQLQGCIADDKEALFFLQDKMALKLNFSHKPKAISLLPLSPHVKGVNLSGVRWPLQKSNLYQTNPYTVSNRLADNSTEILASTTEGILGLYICWQE